MVMTVYVWFSVSLETENFKTCGRPKSAKLMLFASILNQYLGCTRVNCMDVNPLQLL